MLITTERLSLREFCAEDWRAVYSYQNDPRYLEFYEWAHRSEMDVKAFVERFIQQQHAIPRTHFQLALTCGGKLIGNVGIRKQSADGKVASLGYELDPRQWGNGYALEGAHAMLDFGFHELHLHRVWAHCIANNDNSLRLLEKLGMRQEGRWRENEFFKGRWWDTLVYGMLEDEWRWKSMG